MDRRLASLRKQPQHDKNPGTTRILARLSPEDPQGAVRVGRGWGQCCVGGADGDEALTAVDSQLRQKACYRLSVKPAGVEAESGRIEDSLVSTVV
jgi:hypothetical protein